MPSLLQRKQSLQPKQSHAVPEIVTQVVCAAVVLCVGEILFSPFIVSMASNAGIALIPWACVACMLAVFFCFTVGFALLWAIDYVASQIKQTLRARIAPYVFGLGGFIGFGAWGYFVIPAIFNTLLAGVSAQPLTFGQRLATGFNCAVLGFVAWFVAKLTSPKLSEHTTAVIVIGVCVLVMAALGVFYFASMLYYVSHS